MTTRFNLFAFLLAGLLASSAPLHAQAAGTGYPGPAGGRTAHAGGFQLNLRQMLLGRVQQSVGFTDEEWTVVEPRLWTVATLQLALGQGPVAQFTSRLQRFAATGDAAAPDTDPLAQVRAQEDPPVAALSQQFQQVTQQLQALANDPTSTDAQLVAALAEYRANHQKIDDALAVAQKNLQSVLTLRQESLLLLMDYLN